VKKAEPNKKLRELASALATALLFVGLAAPAWLPGDAAGAKPVRWSATDYGHTILTRSMWLNHCVPASQVVSWKLECGLGGATGSRLEQLHIWLGEYALAHDHDPYLADWHFAQAQAAGTRMRIVGTMRLAPPIRWGCTT